MLTFDQCLGIRDACISIKHIVDKARYRKLSMSEREDIEVYLAKIEAHLNVHPTVLERVYAYVYKKIRRRKKGCTKKAVAQSVS